MSIANAKQSLTFATVASASLAADATSDVIDANASQVVTTAIQLAWTGTPTGSVFIDGSLDGSNWSQLATVALAGSAGASLNEVTSCALSLRVRYVRSSGTGTLTGVYLSRTGGSLAGASAGAASHVIVDSGTISLPTGASTAAKQPALGTAGTASTDVITVQGIAGGTAQPVTPAPVSTVVRASDTNVAAGTRRTFTSAPCTQGFYFSNPHATATAFIGDPATVSSTIYDFRVLAGQRSEWFPVANPSQFGWDTDTSGMVLKIVGG